jgi:putative ABC transport system permease protein
VLAFVNVQDRLGELGILRALGVRAGHVFALFLARAIVVGVTGGVLGYASGIATGVMLGEGGPVTSGLNLVWQPLLAGVMLLAAPAVCAAACLLPALRAARQDPALVLQQET